MKLPAFELEDWFRRYYFNVDIVLCESGVEPYTLGDVRKLTSLSTDELDNVELGDSPPEGGGGVRTAIAKRWARGDVDGVLVTHGSSEAIFLIMNALLSKGDEVLVVSPCYQPLRSIPEGIGCHVTQWRLDADQGFLPDLSLFKSLVAKTRARMVILNFPNNPTGTSLDHDQFKELIDVVSAKGIYLLWDSAFTELSYDRTPLPDPRLSYDRSITVGTLTKTYGLGGLRIGWCLTSPEIVQRCIDIRGYVTVNCSPLTELVAQRAIERLDLFLKHRLNQARTNRDILRDWIRAHNGRIEWTPPQGGVTALLRLPSVADTESFCHRFANECRIFLLPGTCFGFPDRVRLGFGGATSRLIEGLDRLSHFLAEIEH